MTAGFPASSTVLPRRVTACHRRTLPSLACMALAGTYPIDAHLDKLGPTDHVFLFLTWHRMGFYPERLQRYARFPCQACWVHHATSFPLLTPRGTPHPVTEAVAWALPGLHKKLAQGTSE